MSRYGRHIHRLNKIRVFAVVVLVFFITAAIILVSRAGGNSANNTTQELLRAWNVHDYESAYQISKDALNDKPVDYFLLTTSGFSAYQLGISQINNQNTLFYIDESIRSLRKALLNKKSFKNNIQDARVYYVLGKAYNYKGDEYSDLAIKYLEMADNLSYEAEDIPEYLGLAYASAGDYRSSVEAFSRAFKQNKAPTDNLLLSIARSYIAMEDYDLAHAYLNRCIDNSPDSKTVNLARQLSAEIYIKTNDFEKAEEQYLSIIETIGENAEVRYLLGELFLLKGDTTRARAEWRTAYRQDPANTKVRARLNI